MAEHIREIKLSIQVDTNKSTEGCIVRIEPDKLHEIHQVVDNMLEKLGLKVSDADSELLKVVLKHD